MAIEVKQYEREIPDKVGLVDGGHIIMKCSSCSKPLVDIWITNPKKELNWVGVATCCYCGDKSFEYRWKGGYGYAGYSEENPDNPDEPIEHTKVSVVTEDIITFKTTRVR